MRTQSTKSDSVPPNHGNRKEIVRIFTKVIAIKKEMGAMGFMLQQLKDYEAYERRNAQ